ncbi:hypothetical protein CC86DRAFT_54317 [Ophiobolus disseminans]|uniref:Mid2 domain-containing protein n=1 Tax=Ophiobolus disseminans TaxID=1469910 RepID=A0A6A6ZTE8_9PLEO|nr:hypothetical protein CC86DRAFT_54317 [Ophiobolus disseminans]
MLTHLALGSALLSGSYATLVAPSQSAPAVDALITPGPQVELLKKQNNAAHIGWISFGGQWSSQTCDPGNTYYQAGGQWGCCSTGAAGCRIAIGCFNGNMIFQASSTARANSTGVAPAAVSYSLVTHHCSSMYTASEDKSITLCNTAYMFENERDADPKVNIVCGMSSIIWSYYRQRPGVATSAPSSSALSSSALSSLAKSSIDARPSSTPASSTATRSSTPTPAFAVSGGEEDSESKAWIAGVVLGPIVGLALLALGLFSVLRRKKNKNTKHHSAPASGSATGPGANAYPLETYPTTPSSSSQPPQYHPSTQQHAGAAPFGVAKQDGYFVSDTQSPVISQGFQSPYGNAPQPWQQPGAQSAYGAPSPLDVQHAEYHVSEARPFSSAFESDTGHGKPEVISVHPKR